MVGEEETEGGAETAAPPLRLSVRNTSAARIASAALVVFTMLAMRPSATSPDLPASAGRQRARPFRPDEGVDELLVDAGVPEHNVEE